MTSPAAPRRRTPAQALLFFGAVGVTAASILAVNAFTGLGGMWGVLTPLFAVLASYGVMTGNIGAGALSFGAGALAASAAAAFHDGTARPLAVVVLFCMTSAQVAARTLAVPR